MHQQEPDIDKYLIAGLTRAIDWMDNSLQQVLAAKGFAPVHRTQSLILVHIANGIDAPADIAREMGLTRQNVHQMAKGLIAEGVIDQYPDPADPRRSRYGWTERSFEIRRAARETLSNLEQVVKARTGVSDDEMRAFRKVLSADWGPEVSSDSELQQALPGPDTETDPTTDDHPIATYSNSHTWPAGIIRKGKHD